MGTYTVSYIQKLVHKVIEVDLHGRDILIGYSYQELAEIYNGIGPDWMPEKIRDLCTKWGELFEPAALIHDVEYFLGGTEEDFKNCNEKFKRNGARLARAKFSAWNPCRLVWINRARRWGNWCQIFGRIGYNFTSGNGEAAHDTV